MEGESSMNRRLTAADILGAMPPVEELLVSYGYESDEAETKPREMDLEQPQESKADSEADVKTDEEPKADVDASGDGKGEGEGEMETDPLEDVSKIHLEPSTMTIMVGQDYQARIPDGFCSYNDALIDKKEDKLLWDPYPLPEAQIEEYLWRATVGLSSVTSVPKGCQLRDDEEALFLLLQCGHNVEEALRLRRITSLPAEQMSLWSEEECRNFENWLATYGKDIHDTKK